MVKSFFSDPLMDGFIWEPDHAGIVTDNKINKNVVSTIWPVTEIDTFIVFFFDLFPVDGRITDDERPESNGCDDGLS